MNIMTIEEMREHEWTISWSGGKDSTATVILCHEYGIPIKEITYVRMMYDENTPATLPIMTEFVDRAKCIFEEWGYLVRIEYGIENAVEIANKKFKQSSCLERNGRPYGVMAFMRGMCKFTDVKQRTLSKLALSGYQMIGYAIDETDRLKLLSKTKQSIMVTLNIIENETFDICRKYNLLSPFYDLGLSRDGCWFCPNAKEEDRDMLRKKHPHLALEIDKMIELCDYDIKGLVARNNWVKDYFKEREKPCNEVYQQLELDWSEGKE